MNGHALFLSYDSVDRPSVVAIQKLLAPRGITTFLDRDQLVPGLPWPTALEEGLRDVQAVAVFIGKELGGWQKREMWFALDRQVREEKQGHPFPVIPVLLAGADPTPSFLFTNTWIDLRGGLDTVAVAEPLDAFENAINASTRAQPPPAERAVRPYRGLEAFREEDAAFFAGRVAFASELLNFTLGKELVAVVGPSGSGKSSVVQAGLVPRLRRQLPPATTWDIVTFTPGSDPFLRLASTLTPLLEQNLSETDRLTEAQKLGKRLADDEIRLESVIDRVIKKSNGTGRLLVMADQFEELFTLTQGPSRLPFARALVRALGKAPFTLLVTLRADFYSQIIALDRELSDRLAPAQVNIGALTREELRESIIKPAKLVGLEFEPGLVDRILRDVGSEPGNLPLLEFALTGLWSQRQNRSLTNAAYDDIGGVTGALAQRAEAAFARFAPEEQTAARRLLSRLVRVARPDEGAEDTRQRIELQATDPVAEKVALALAGPEIRLLVMGKPEGEELSGGQIVEVAHEALIRNWGRLRGWLNEDREFLLWRQRLQIQVEQWNEHGRDASYLLRGVSLSEGERWLTGRPQDLMATQQQFIQKSSVLRKQEHEEEERRRQGEIENANRMKEAAEARAAAEQHAREAAEGRASAETQLREKARSTAVRFRWFSIVLAVMLLIAIGATWDARRQQLIAESRQLAAQAQEALSRDQAAALNLALTAWQTADTSEAHSSVANSFPQLLAILQGHTSAISSAVFSPDGQRILTGSDDGTARVWNAASGEPLATLEGHTGFIRSAVFSPDGQRIVTGWGQTAEVWNAATGQLVATLQGDIGEGAWSAVFSLDSQRIVTASRDLTARVWNAASGQLLATLQGHTEPVFSAVFSPDGQRIVTASDDKTARVWDAASGHLLATLQGHTDAVSRAAFSRDGQRIVTASDDKTARVWDAASGQLLATLQGHTDTVSRAAFSPDGQRIVTASEDNTARVWNAASGQPLATLRGHTSYVVSAEFSPDGQRIVTASNDNTARLWSAVSVQLLATLHGDIGDAERAEFSPDGQRIVTASGDKTARVWNADSGQLLATLHGHAESVLSAVFSPDGQRIVTASGDKTARVWNADSGQLLATLHGHTDAVRSAIFSPDGHRILTASEDSTTRVWNADSGQLLATLHGHTGAISSAVFSPDGQRIVTAGWNQAAEVWNAASGQLVATLQGQTESGAEGRLDRVLKAVFSPDGRRIVTTYLNQTAEVWNTDNGQLLATLQGHTDWVLSAMFSPDSQRIVTASDDKTARVWNAATGQPLAILQGHSSVVRSAMFSPDGQRIVTASQDKTARVWNANSGLLLAILQGHTDTVWSAVFSPDGQRIVTSSAYTKRVFRVVTLSEIADLLAK
jgi:WD40 repeat protein